ncbi:ankyrin repeat domain containing protein [Pandoravirus celtis]|uniref:Ankyrin repeat domain containing protein n=1 Tax=Pandoravirus celtis TaxID=2568002 RepID=A0A4D6EJH1_9VIRU|nr:ankyrin repeat domain containing protein [Pandoravirus celtis]
MTSIDTLPAEIIALVLARLPRDRDFCRARMAHRCFRVDSDKTLADRAQRWRGEPTPERFCAVGLVEALEVLHARGVAMGPGCLVAAASAGHVDVLAFLQRINVPFDVALPPIDTRDIRCPIPTSLRKVTLVAISPSQRTMAAQVNAYVRSSLIDRAAAGGHLAAVKWLSNIPGLKATTVAMDWAAAGGHTDVVAWLHENRTEGCTKGAMDMAAASGHLSTVVWLHENRREGCTATAMDAAAAGGHLDIVRFLHERRSEGCTTDAIDCAAIGGHLAVVRFLCRNRTEGFTRAATDEAAAEGHEHVASCLRAQMDAASDRDDAEVCRPRPAAIADGDNGDDCARTDKRKLPPSIKRAVIKGDVAALEQACERDTVLLGLRPSQGRKLWTWAALGGHIDVARWLDAHSVRGYDDVTTGVALGLGNLDFVRWLWDLQWGAPSATRPSMGLRQMTPTLLRRPTTVWLPPLLLWASTTWREICART